MKRLYQRGYGDAMTRKSYFISGASSGLGEEMARQLAARGDSVALAARRVGRLDSLAGELAGSSRVTVHALDVTDAPAVDAAIRTADEQHNGLDVVVVNAGRGGGGRIGTGRLDENRAVIDTNLVGALSQAEAALSLFRERGRGQLVLVSSLAANRGLPGSAAVYSASKAALASVGESLRIELAGSGITVTTLRPGYIATPLNERHSGPYRTPLSKGVASMISAIDSEAGDVVVPGWPWRPVSWLLRVAPSSLIRRFG